MKVLFKSQYFHAIRIRISLIKDISSKKEELLECFFTLSGRIKS